MSARGVGPANAIRRAKANDLDDLDAGAIREAYEQASDQVAEAVAAGVSVIGRFDARYPPALADVPSAPAVLWVRGNVEMLSQPMVAVVGTRSPTRFGQAAAEAITLAAARAGVGCVSGLALGVDGCAHQVALSAGAANVAVLASGVLAGEVHPPRHQALSEQILASGGVLVSENAPGTETHPHLLVARNRIQSGLSLAVVVAQTGLTGGTPHTARFALAQGRPLFVAAPRRDEPQSAGNLALLQTPAEQLPASMAAFKGADAMLRRRGPGPVAQPLRSEDLPAWAAGLRRAAPAPVAEEQRLF
jgi:DNA processing protein